MDNLGIWGVTLAPESRSRICLPFLSALHAFSIKYCIVFLIISTKLVSSGPTQGRARVTCREGRLAGLNSGEVTKRYRLAQRGRFNGTSSDFLWGPIRWSSNCHANFELDRL